MQDESKQERLDLIQRIKESIHEIASEKQASSIKSLSVYDPDKVAKMLYLYSTGASQTKLVRKYGYDRETVISVLADYADHMGKFRELSGRIAAKNYLNLSSLEEDSFRDLKELSIAKANSAREALTARGEATQITEDRKVYTQDEYEATIQAARDRIEKAKIIDAEVQDAD
jgi:hypothetical protein